METGKFGDNFFKENGGMGEFGFKVTDWFVFGAEISPMKGSTLSQVQKGHANQCHD